ncbi:MAG: CHASE3 domain-containing protein [Beijerinckiaceae bacterium]
MSLDLQNDLAGSRPEQTFGSAFGVIAGWGVAILMIAAVVASASLYMSDRRQTDMDALTRAQATARSLQALWIDAETGQRGYLLTGSESYLAPYQHAIGGSDLALARLNIELASHALFTPQLSEIARLQQEKARELSQTIALYRSGRAAEAISIVASDHGRQIMDGMRTNFAAMERDLAGLIAVMNQRRNHWNAALWASCIIALLASLLIMVRQLALATRSVQLLAKDRVALAETNIGLRDQMDINKAELRKVATLLAAIADSTPDAIYAKDETGRLIFANRACLDILGKSADVALGLRQSDLSSSPEEARRIEQADSEVLASGVVVVAEEPFTAAGKQIIFLSTKAPLRDKDGIVRGLVGISTDITERKRHEEQAAFLMAELGHRTKNLLTVVQSIARQTAKNAPSLEAFRDEFVERVSGIARSMDLLIVKGWTGVSLIELIRTQTAPIIGPEGQRLRLSGPDITLRPDAAQNIGLALHELATNAAKYGALTVTAGYVELMWSVMPESDGTPMIKMSWKERGGPAVTTPTRTGFGHTVMNRLVKSAIAGEASLDFVQDGVSWKMSAPLANIVARASGSTRQ